MVKFSSYEMFCWICLRLLFYLILLSLVGIQYYISYIHFRCIIQWFNIFIPYNVIALLILAIICHRANLSQYSPSPSSPLSLPSNNHPFGLWDRLLKAVSKQVKIEICSVYFNKHLLNPYQPHTYQELHQVLERVRVEQVKFLPPPPWLIIRWGKWKCRYQYQVADFCKPPESGCILQLTLCQNVMCGAFSF